MRRIIAILSAFTAVAVAACSPGSAEPVEAKGEPTAVASTAAAAVSESKDAVCLGYRQQQGLIAETFLEAAFVLIDPSVSASQFDTASMQVKQAYTQLRSWMDVQLAGTTDPQIKGAFETLVALLKQGLAELESAGRDGRKMVDVITSERISAAEEEVLKACGQHGLLPHPTPR